MLLYLNRANDRETIINEAIKENLQIHIRYNFSRNVEHSLLFFIFL